MKKFLAFLLAAVLLAGCAAQDTGLPPQTTAPTPVTTTQPAPAPATSPAGQNNLNNNTLCQTGSWGSNTVTAMLSDGEDLFVSTLVNSGNGGIFRLAPGATDLTGAQQVFLPDRVDRLTFPLTFGILDEENLCVVIPHIEPVPDAFNDLCGLYVIPKDGSATGTGPEPYRMQILYTEGGFQPHILDGWLYYVVAITDDTLVNCTYELQRLRITGDEEPETLLQFAQHSFTGVFSEDGSLLFFALPMNGETNATTIAWVDPTDDSDLRFASPVPITRMLGCTDGWLYVQSDGDVMRINTDDGTAQPVFSGCVCHAINFTSDAVYLISGPLLYRVPLDSLGGSDYPCVDLQTVAPDKYNQYQAGAISGPLLETYDPCLWVWDDKLWTFYSENEWFSTLHAISDSLLASMGNAPTAAISGKYSMAFVPNAPIPTLEFFPETGRLEARDVELETMNVSPGAVVSTSYREVEGGIEISFPFGWKFYEVSMEPGGFAFVEAGGAFLFLQE